MTRFLILAAASAFTVSCAFGQSTDQAVVRLDPELDALVSGLALRVSWPFQLEVWEIGVPAQSRQIQKR